MLSQARKLVDQKNKKTKKNLFDIFPSGNWLLDIKGPLSLFNLKKVKNLKKKRWGRHELAIVRLCVTIGRIVSIRVGVLWRARAYFSSYFFKKASRSILLHCGASSEFIRSNYRWRGARTKGADWWNAIGVRATLFIRWAMMGGKFETRRDGPDDSKVRLLAHSLVAYTLQDSFYLFFSFFLKKYFFFYLFNQTDVWRWLYSRKYSSLLIVRLLQTFYPTLRLSLSIAAFRPCGLNQLSFPFFSNLFSKENLTCRNSFVFSS